MRNAVLDPQLLLRLHAGQRRQSGGPLGLRSPVDLHRRRGADERQHDGFLGLFAFSASAEPFSPGTSVAAISGCRFTFTPACGIVHLPAAHRRLRRLERYAVLARRAGNRLGVFQAQFDLLRLLALLLDQQPVVLPVLPTIRAVCSPNLAEVIAASESRSGISRQPSTRSSILSFALTWTTSFSTVASFSISVITAPTGGLTSAAG